MGVSVIDDLLKSTGLHSISAYCRGPVYIYIGPCLRVVRRVGTLLLGYNEHVRKMTDTRKQRQKIKASEMPIKHSLFVGNMQFG